jgi:NAD(P)-dependent dehydrogenase (short-subunit alcohol dehydrogenase family)
MQFQEMTALITGSTSGIGRAIAEAFAREGACVVVSGRDQGRGRETVEHIQRAGGTAAFVRGDLSTVAGARSLARQATSAFGAIDILVSNAGA